MPHAHSIKLEGQTEQLQMAVAARVVRRSLELLDMRTQEPLKRVDFGSAYFGTDQTQCAMIFNNSPDPVEFVVLMDENAVGQVSY